MAHLLVDISGHGFGHAGQVLPLVRALLDRDPGLRVTLRAAVPAAKLREHLGAEVPVQPPGPDVGLVMHGPMDVDAAASAAAYAQLHADLDAEVRAEADRIAPLAPDLLLADVPYVSLAAAKRLGLPAVALCSLNWAQAYRAYCADAPEAARIAAEIREAYAAADLFLQPRPHAPMPDLPNARPIGPIFRAGRCAPDALRAALGLAADTRLVLVAFGGIPGRRGMGPLPAGTGLAWLLPGGDPSRGDVYDADRLCWPFSELAASVDAVLTKTGYGTVCETLAAGTRLLYVGRPDWPEHTAMTSWAQTHGTVEAIGRDALAAGDYGGALARLLSRPRGSGVAPTGIADAMQALRPWLPAGGAAEAARNPAAGADLQSKRRSPI
jgi:hypothetical protein